MKIIIVQWDETLPLAPHVKVFEFAAIAMENRTAFDGNLFDMKQFQEVDGYEEYISRYAASKKKIT